MAAEMDIDNIFNYELEYPPCLEQIMNLLSTNKSYLLTTGYLLEEKCIQQIYDNLGTDNASLTGIISDQNIYVTDDDYINDFRGPISKNCLI